MSTNRRWRTVFGAVAAACAFLLIQTDVSLDPTIKMLVGLTSIVVAYLKAPTEDAPE